MPERAYQKSLRSSVLFSNLTYQSNRSWISLVFLLPRFIVGTTIIKLAGQRLCTINHRGRPGSGIVSLDLITSPAFIAIKAADEFRDKTTEINQLWQTDFTYLKGIGWGWMYLSTILDDYSRDMIAWKPCTTMKTGNVNDTLTLALQSSGCDQAHVMNKPRRYRTTDQVTSLASLLNGWVTRTRLIKLGKRYSRYVKISRGGYSDNSSVS